MPSNAINMSFAYSFAATLMSRFSFPVASISIGASSILPQVVLHPKQSPFMSPFLPPRFPLLDWFQYVNVFHALKMLRWDMLLQI